MTEPTNVTIDAWSKAGVMIRSAWMSNAPNAFVAVTPGNGVTWQYRSSTNGGTANAVTGDLSAPYWVKLVRSGNTFTGYRSPDGTNWTQQGDGHVHDAVHGVCGPGSYRAQQLEPVPRRRSTM